MAVYRIQGYSAYFVSDSSGIVEQIKSSLAGSESETDLALATSLDFLSKAGLEQAVDFTAANAASSVETPDATKPSDDASALWRRTCSKVKDQQILTYVDLPCPLSTRVGQLDEVTRPLLSSAFHSASAAALDRIAVNIGKQLPDPASMSLQVLYRRLLPNVTRGFGRRRQLTQEETNVQM
ncbi:hypothetical protein BC831DRAFT_97948 [Entophlyctis helioformis]|nr:hypothetical protein BC831DRAFT_97948 [Entophlyctis helioformis]